MSIGQFVTIGILMYLVGIFLYVYDNTKMWCTVTHKVAIKSLIWPVLFVIWFVKVIMVMLNAVVLFIAVVFKYDYLNTEMNKRIVSIIYK